MFMINKMNNDNLLNVLVNIKMATYIYKTQNNLNLNHNKKQHILYNGLYTNSIKHFKSHFIESLNLQII